jgi:hypothetical protein
MQFMDQAALIDALQQPGSFVPMHLNRRPDHILRDLRRLIGERVVHVV